MIKVIDGHCDVLSKMYTDPTINLYSDHYLDVTLPRMKNIHMLMQLFAIYLPEKITHPTFDHILEFIQIFHEKILSTNEFIFVRSKEELQLLSQQNKIGALLTLEGADALMGNFTYLHILYKLGVRCIGITWNYANWAADGVMEPRQGGFTLKGKQLISECNHIGMVLDVSHLTEMAFWELNDLSMRPFIASHSNAFQICNHPRNLKNEQIIAIIQKKGIIGLTFVPYFLNTRGSANISDLLKHIDHICALGGSKHIAFGSDFDGISQWTEGLEHTGKYNDLRNLLYKYYHPHLVDGFLWENWYSFFDQQLPSK